jgi:hypothetical protein
MFCPIRFSTIYLGISLCRETDSICKLLSLGDRLDLTMSTMNELIHQPRVNISRGRWFWKDQARRPSGPGGWQQLFQFLSCSFFCSLLKTTFLHLILNTFTSIECISVLGLLFNCGIKPIVHCIYWKWLRRCILHDLNVLITLISSPWTWTTQNQSWNCSL